MASKGKGGTGRKAWPREKRSRRDGWTQGRALEVASGDVWYMPAVDWSLAPNLNFLTSIAYHVRAHFEAWFVHGDHSAAMAALVDDWFAEYLTTTLEIQYRNRRQTLSDLAFGRKEDREDLPRLNAAFDAVIGHARDVIAFSDRHIPAGSFLERADLRSWLAVN